MVIPLEVFRIVLFGGAGACLLFAALIHPNHRGTK